MFSQGTVVIADTVDSEDQGVDDSRVEIIVEGTLVCEGTPGDPVVFGAVAGTGPGAWYGIRVLEGGGVELGNGCRIEHAYNGLTILAGADTTLVRGVSVVAAENAGFWIESNAAALVSDSVFDVDEGYGICLFECDATIDSCYVEACETGIYAYVTSSEVTNTSVQGDGMYGILVNQICAECSEAEDTLWVEDTQINGYFSQAHVYAGLKGHCSLEDCEMISGVAGGASDSSSYILRAQTDAWVKLRNSTIRDWFEYGYGVYSYKSDADLGQHGADRGFNSIHPTDTAAGGWRVRHVTTVSTDSVKAEGNWWGSDSVSSYWFYGRVDYTPWESEAPLGKLAPSTFEEDELSLLPREHLAQNYPNPFNPSTTMEFSLPAPAFVEISIYNILGQRVRRLGERAFSAGLHQITWDGEDERGRPLASGIYLYRIATDGWQETKKMVLLK